MRKTAWEFRLRLFVMVAVVAMGFWAPWISIWGLGRRISLLEWLALTVSRTGLLRFTQATVGVILLASLIAGCAALLRVWGAACLGPDVVNSFALQSGTVVAAGPYRYVRNPLYLGTWGVVCAISFAMPATGALFTLVLITAFLVRLIFVEEAFLAEQIGEPYREYRGSVPRLFPRLRSTLPRSVQPLHWGRAILAETNPIGVFVIMAALTWRYDNQLLVRAVLINFGISLVIRALLLSSEPKASIA